MAVSGKPVTFRKMERLIFVAINYACMKKIFIAISILLISTAALAQEDYKNAIGGRFAPDSYYDFLAFSYKGFVTETGAIELNAGAGSRRFRSGHPFVMSVSGTYQHHFEIPLRGLRWFVGGGLTAYNSFHSDPKVKGFGFGFYPTAGIDWKIPNIPLNLSADYRPTIMVIRPDIGDAFEATQFGFVVRYTLDAR